MEKKINSLFSSVDNEGGGGALEKVFADFNNLVTPSIGVVADICEEANRLERTLAALVAAMKSAKQEPSRKVAAAMLLHVRYLQKELQTLEAVLRTPAPPPVS